MKDAQNATSKIIRIGIVDDHHLFRKSLEMLVNSFSNMKVVMDVGTGDLLIEKLKVYPIDILLLDLNMPGMDGFEVCKQLNENYTDIKILIVSQQTSEDSVQKILELGAQGYFTKNSEPKMLQAAINDLSEKGYYFEGGIRSFLREAMYIDYIDEQPSNIILSKREIEIVKMAAMEYNSLQIGIKLHISLSTVETHRKRIMDKTESKNFIGVVLFALRNNYFHISDL